MLAMMGSEKGAFLLAFGGKRGREILVSLSKRTLISGKSARLNRPG